MGFFKHPHLDNIFTLFSIQALAHKTLVLLLGVDPSKQLDHPLPTAHPHVTYAYMKYMWKSNRKVGANCLLVRSWWFTFSIL